MKTQIDQTLIDTLAKHLNCSTDDITPAMYDNYGLTVLDVGNQQYAIGNDTQANAAVFEYIKNSAWAFNASFLAEMTDLPVECFQAMQSKYEDSNDAVLKLIEKTCGLEDFVSSAISADGRGHFIAQYDNNEVELNGLFIYRLN